MGELIDGEASEVMVELMFGIWLCPAETQPGNKTIKIIRINKIIKGLLCISYFNIYMIIKNRLSGSLLFHEDIQNTL